MIALTKGAILAAGDCRREKVEIPEWGGCVYVAAVSAAEWMGFQDAVNREKDEKPATSPWVGLMLVRAIVGEDGQRIFTDEDAPELMKKPLSIINRLYRAADALNDFTGRGLRDAEKNSKEGVGEDSPTLSLVN